MSTILKALKKLEQEKEALKPAGPTPVFSSPDTTIGGVTGWFRTPWVRRAAVGFIIITLSVAAFYFYRQSRPHSLKQADRTAAIQKHAPTAGTGRNISRPSTMASVPKKGANPVEPENSRRPDQPASELPSELVQTNPRSTGVNPDYPRADLPPDTKAAQSPVQERSLQTPIPATGAARLPDGASRRPGPADIPAVETPAPSRQTGQPGAATEKPAAKASPATVKKTSSDAFANVPELTDGRLKVHAIAWSPSVEKRMAVVNNRVIYEGDSVDDFIVVAIRPDDVVVREKEKGMWKVVFGRP